MAVVTITSNNPLGDAFFSSYLNSAKETLVLPQNIFSITHNGHIPLGKNKPNFEELDVFSAERYFNGELEEQELTQKIMNKKGDPDATESLKQNTRPATPSVRSESSWNSKSLLLNVPTPQKRPKGNSGWRKSLLASLGCNCSCNDDDAIDVSNHADQGEARKGTNNGHKSRFGRSNSNIWLKENKGEFDKRRSVDVFGSPLQRKGDKQSRIEKEVKMLAWEAIPQRECTETNSESSSDLFEIDSFSTNYTNPYLVRQESDVMSGCITPTTCYAPSEASVQWSTVTASMADFSVMSDSEELDTIPARTSWSKKVRGRNIQANKPTTNKSHGILASCKSHKTVRVSGEAQRTTDKTYSDLQRPQRKQTRRF